MAEEKDTKKELAEQESQTQPEDSSEQSQEVSNEENSDAEAIEEPEQVIEEQEEVAEVEDVESETKPKFIQGTDGWEPKTEIGRQVKIGELTDIDEILDQGKRIMEPEIVTALLPNLEIELLEIGQSKGKFGGGQRRVFRQTQKKTREGNKPKFSAFAVCGDFNGYVGYGFGKTKETVPAREKAFRNCKLNLFKITRGCSSWECTCGKPHTIPFKVTGKCGSVEVTLIPAPKGTGLCVEKET
ncbi:MAG: hypothetical protein ACQESF_05510, partial [Nanobdellota archaeon]